jgi:hypothetical protein
MWDAVRTGGFSSQLAVSLAPVGAFATGAFFSAARKAATACGDYVSDQSPRA